MITKTPILRFSLIAAVVIVAAALVPVALAGRGGSHGATTAASALTVSSSSVAAGDAFTVTGCGYAQDQPVNVTVDSPSAQFFFPVSVDGNGCISFGEYTSEAGLYTAKTYQSGNGGKQTLLATATITAT